MYKNLILLGSFLFFFVSCDDGSGQITQEETQDVTEIPASTEADENQDASAEVAEGDDLTNSVMSSICSESGYAWETVDNSNDIYTALVFNGSEFRIAAYIMNGSANPKDFTRTVDFSGTWKMVRNDKAEGVMNE